MKRTAGAIALLLVIAACGDATKTEEYQALLGERNVISRELEDATEELADVTEELDESQADADAVEAQAQAAETDASNAESELASFMNLAEEFMAASLAAVGAPDEADCLLSELSLEAIFTAGIFGADPVGASASIDPVLLGEIAAAGLACGGADPFNTSALDRSVFNLEIGDCFDDSALALAEVESVPAVDCAEPHDNEIYFEYSMTDTVFPGDDATMDAAFSRCLDDFDGFVGIAYVVSELDFFPIVPTATSWMDGDRVVYCALYALDLSKLTGTMQGSRR